MTFKQLSLLLIILWIHGFSCEVIPSDISNCSKIEAEFDTLPSIRFTSKSPVDADFILMEAKVRRISNQTRTFSIQCWAPYPITMLSTSDIKNGKVIDKMKNNLKLEHFKSHQIYMATSIFVVEPNEELHFDARCITTCDPNRFPYGVNIYTKDAGGENVNKIFAGKVSSNLEESTRSTKRFLHLFVCLGWFAVCGMVIIALIMIFGYLLWRQGGSKVHDMPLSVLIS